MHMRNKKWARPELHQCPYYTDEPEQFKGKWRQRFSDDSAPLYMELGCGKGVSTAQMIAANTDKNYIVIDIADNVLGDTRRNIAKQCEGNENGRVMIVKTDIEYIERVFSEKDRIERIYIHFCNPWTKRAKHEKRRLTHPRQLLQYRQFLVDNGEIWFKTDDDILFNDSLLYFDTCGFRCEYITYDLHASGFQENYRSEHEMKFSSEGIPIKFAVFRKQNGDFNFDATRWVKPVQNQ